MRFDSAVFDAVYNHPDLFCLPLEILDYPISQSILTRSMERDNVQKLSCSKSLTYLRTETLLSIKDQAVPLIKSAIKIREKLDTLPWRRVRGGALWPIVPALLFKCAWNLMSYFKEWEKDYECTHLNELSITRQMVLSIRGRCVDVSETVSQPPPSIIWVLLYTLLITLCLGSLIGLILSCHFRSFLSTGHDQLLSGVKQFVQEVKEKKDAYFSNSKLIMDKISSLEVAISQLNRLGNKWLPNSVKLEQGKGVLNDIINLLSFFTTLLPEMDPRFVSLMEEHEKIEAVVSSKGETLTFFARTSDRVETSDKPDELGSQLKLDGSSEYTQ